MTDQKPPKPKNARPVCADCKKTSVRAEGCRCKACAEQRALDAAEAEGW